MEKAVSGMTLAVYSSEATLDDAVSFMQANGVPRPMVFVFGSDGTKYEHAVEKFRLSNLHPEVSLHTQSVENDVLSQPLFDSDDEDDVTFANSIIQIQPPQESIVKRVQGSPVVTKIKDTLKSLHKSLLSSTPSKPKEPSKFARDVLSDTFNAEIRVDEEVSVMDKAQQKQ